MYDVIIIGAGPAGMSAAIYAARYKLRTLLISAAFGGAMAEAHQVENYPGFLEISGTQLAEQMQKQVGKLKVETVEEEVVSVERSSDLFILNKKYKSRYLVLCLGCQRRKLNLPKEKDFLGKGISYCATCDAPLFKDKTVAVVGGRDAAVMAAELLAKYAKKVYIIYRREKLNAQPLTAQKAADNEKTEILYNTKVVGIRGSQFLEAISLDSKKELKVDGLFIEIGSTPSVVLARELGVELDSEDYVIVDQRQKTSAQGVYAAGDMTTNSGKWRQIVAACAEGAVASRSIFQEMTKKDANEP